MWDFVSAWSRASEHMATSFLEANRAAIAWFGGNGSLPVGEEDAGREEGSGAERRPAAVPELAYRESDWSFDRTADSRETLTVGDTVRFTKRISREEVEQFAAISGDTNRLHLDAEFAEGTRFGEPIVHGTLVSGLISSALARVPGLTIYLSQDLRFLAPVEIGATLTAICEVVEDLGDHRFRLTTRVVGEDGEAVIDGEAIVLLDDLPE